jgi:hypothetical protein
MKPIRDLLPALARVHRLSPELTGQRANANAKDDSDRIGVSIYAISPTEPDATSQRLLRQRKIQKTYGQRFREHFLEVIKYRQAPSQKTVEKPHRRLRRNKVEIFLNCSQRKVC